MAKSINYRQLTVKAFRGLVADVLSQVARDGLPGKHHFFITFDTTHPGVDMSGALKSRYPKEMTIVMQEWFADLAVKSFRAADTVAAAARKKDGKAVLSGLGNLLGTCNGCHATFRQTLAAPATK